MPIAARGGPRRPSSSNGSSRRPRASSDQDPAKFRKQNYIKTFPHQTPVIMTYDAGDYHASLDKALELADYKNFAKRKRDSARRGKLRGIGFSSYIEACGIAPSQAVGSLGAGVGLWESAEVRVNPTGSVEVLTGSHSHGQGHETTFAQLVSDRLGIPIEQVSIVHGDTDKVQFGMGTYGSRSGAVGMSAIAKAIDKVDRQGQEGRRPRARGRPRATSSSRTASSPSPAPTSRSASAKWRCRPISRTSSRARNSSPV